MQMPLNFPSRDLLAGLLLSEQLLGSEFEVNSIGSFAMGLESAGVLRPESLIERPSADSVLLRQSRSGLSQGVDDAFLGCDSSSRADLSHLIGCE
jgi:hypothetical protein